MAMDDKERMQIRMSKTNKVRLDNMAERYGMSANSLVSYIVGQWLDNNYDMKDRLMETMTRQLEKQAEIIMSNPLELMKWKEIIEGVNLNDVE